MTEIAGISVVQPVVGQSMHWLVRFSDGSCQRRDIDPIRALRLAAMLFDGAAFELGKVYPRLAAPSTETET